MPKLADLIAAIRESGEQTDTFYDDVLAAHAEDTASADAMITELQGKLADANTSLTSVMAHNYTLMQAIPKDEPADTANDEPASDEPSGDSFEDFFTDKNEDK